MSWFACLLGSFSKARFRILGLATIEDIPTEQFNRIVQSLINEDWAKTYEYAGFDAWIDYGCIKLRKGSHKLKFEWDNWTEGSVEGSRRILNRIAAENELSMSNEWRWSERAE